MLGLFHARKLRLHQWAIEHAGWDSVHRALRLTEPFYARFTPAISVRDFALRRGPAGPRARLPRGAAALKESPAAAEGSGSAACNLLRSINRTTQPNPRRHIRRGTGEPPGADPAPWGESPPERGVAQVFARARQLTP